LLLRPTICIVGAEAARIFYDSDRFARHGAMPLRVQKTLLGQEGVQGLDGKAHTARKGMFLSCLDRNGAADLASVYTRSLREEIARWQQADRVTLHDAVALVLCRAICSWSGVPLHAEEESRRTNDLLAMIDAPAAIGPRHWRGRRARSRGNRWAGELVRLTRAGMLKPASGTALDVVASHRGIDGRLLSIDVAAVELLNVLRPTVAINRFVVFAALALEENPRWRERLATGCDDDAESFVQEVRRYYPFFPMAAARVRQPFDWHGVHFPEGRVVVLDLYGTNRDPRTWTEPETFQPERFQDWSGDPFSFIPQGGGDHLQGHRCAGEWTTIEIMKSTIRALTTGMSYEVPDQNLTISLSRMPTGPRSGFVIEHVRALG